MAYTLIAHNGVSLGSGGGTTSFSLDTTGADLLALCFAYQGNTTLVGTDVSDNKGNSYTALTGQTTDNFGASSILCVCQGGTVGTGHTWTLTKASSIASVCVAAFGGSTASPTDQQNGVGSTGGVTSIQPGSVTPTQDNELVLCGMGSGDTAVPPGLGISALTILDQVALVGGTSYGSALAYEIQTTATARNPTWATFFGRASTVIATFKAAAGGGGGGAADLSVMLQEPIIGSSLF